MQPFLRITNASSPGRRGLLGWLGGWLLAALLLGPQLQAQPVLVKDINRKGNVTPENLTDVNGTLFFTIDQGRQLWKTNGTEAGTVLVKDLFADAGRSGPRGFTVVNNLLFFTTDSSSSFSSDLWRSDGTTAGTRIVDSLSYIEDRSLTAVDGLLLFTGATKPGNFALYRSDGTKAGTFLVKDINPGADGVDAFHLTSVDGTLYFVADDGTHGYELYRSDGTAAGTVRLSDINPGAGSAFGWGIDPGFTRVGGTLFFAAEDGTRGRVLCKSDGTPAGTGPVKDVPPGGGFVNPSQLTDVGGTLFFMAQDSDQGHELWKSDGTAAGTVRVRAISPESTGKVAGNFTPVNGTLFFIARTIHDDYSSAGHELWKSDGTAAGTVLVKDINPGEAGAFHHDYFTDAKLIVVGGALYFAADDGTHGSELWKSDGTAAGTVLVKDINPGVRNAWPGPVTPVNGGLLLVAYQESTGFELWRTDGTEAGTTLVRDIDPGRAGSEPSRFAVVGGTVFFRADNGTVGSELWKSDGTPEGTTLVKDVIKSSDSAFESSSNGFAGVDGTFFFRAKDGTNFPDSWKPGLWRSDGTAAGTVKLMDIGPSGFGPAGSSFKGALYFPLQTDTSGLGLWKSDGTAGGTVLVKTIFAGAEGGSLRNLTVAGGTLFFSANDGIHGEELWKSDGTKAGTVPVKDIHPGTEGSIPAYLVNVGGTLYFTANDGTHGHELYKSDGTEAGTVRLTDINPGAGWAFNPDPESDPGLTQVGSTLFFAANDGTHGRELYQNDGTRAGTVKVKSIAPYTMARVGNVLVFSVDTENGRELWQSDGTGPGTTRLASLTVIDQTKFFEMNGTLYFPATDGTDGVELWRTDGTQAGTGRVKDINPGEGSAFPAFPSERVFAGINGTLYFQATDGTRGFELWRSDGTEAGTAMVADLLPGPGGSVPADLLNVNGTLFFSAYGGVEGRELWKYTPPADPPATAWRINAGGGAYTSSAGEAFSADQYANAGRPSTPVTGEIARTQDDLLYRQGRVGERFTYSLPTGNGVYYVVLHFAETYWGNLAGGGEGSRRFNVDVEEHRKLTDYDIYAKAGGALRAVQEAFRVVVRDGQLDVRFSRGGADQPLVSALEVFGQEDFRINVAGPAYRAGKGWFLSDFYGSGGVPSRYAPGEVAATDDDELYRSNRHGSLFNYNLPTGPGTYRVTLHFAETYWGQQAAGGEGSRRFNVNAQGERRLSGYDTYQRAGGAMRAVQEQFDVTVSDQVLNLAFLRGSADNSVDLAHVAAIEVVRLPASNARLASAGAPATGASATGVHPNPVQDKLWVRLPAGEVTATAVSDARGTVLLRGGHRRVGKNELQLDVSTLRPGLYLLRVQSGAGNQQFRFVKQ